MKAMCGSLIGYLLCCFIQNAYAANPTLPVLEVFYNDDFPGGGPGSYYRVNLRLLHGANPGVRDQETLYIAANSIDIGGNFGTPSAECGSGTPYDPNSNFGVQLNFIVDKTTGVLNTDSTVRADANTAFTPTPGYIADATAVCTDGLRVVIQTFTATANTDTPGIYSVYFDFTLGNPGTFGGVDPGVLIKGIQNYINPSWVVPPPVPPIDLTAPTIAATLKVIDASDAEVSVIGLGDKLKLKLTVTVTTGANYISGLDVAGAIVKQCEVEPVSGTTVTFIDNYCSVNTAIFSTSTVGTGFTKQSSVSTATSNTYIAFSHDLEAGIIFSTPGTTITSQDLIFRCTIEFNCYDDTDTAAKCGGDHCTGAKRKKRSAEIGGEHSVETKLTVVTADHKLETSEPPRPCAETVTFKATIGVLGTTAVLLFFGVIFSFSDMKRAQRKAKAREHSLDTSTISRGSTAQLKANSLY